MVRQRNGLLYLEHHLKKKNADGTPVRYDLWTAEVSFNGKRYRRKSKDIDVCLKWLEDVNAYQKGERCFPSRQQHPGEDPFAEAAGAKPQHRRRNIKNIGNRNIEENE